ncbi:ABC transporter ATP-binding protein [Halogeometricum sp. S1BR25-6]|uniref:ABC transporter ATP-binding protein n=1 Tax=Halogeometricum salsisoli TaxID=2950536 RepID=A0ABU2GJL6_9EURY|nr:ABC transporter ATP-binding protein [Halogeometricum sp. S1BR25-6]MDS0300484.1 ABC transporter ATP-binding protein [Halogeometricum sp. S1BR25-6]
MPAIDASDLTKRYGDTLAVDGLSLSVPEGTVYGFLGSNGAGKTTTMRMLTGLSKPTAGTAAVGGAVVTDRAALRPRIGYMPEEPPLYDQATAFEQLEYVGGLRGIDAETARARGEELFEALGLDVGPADRIDDFSKGMRQKVAYAQTVLHDPAVVFLDEPTSGLDPRAARTLRDRIRRLADEGTTVFLSTHILPVVEEAADAVGILYEGSLVAEGSPDELVARAEAGEGGTLEDAFLDVTSSDPTQSGRSDEATENGNGPREESTLDV